MLNRAKFLFILALFFGRAAANAQEAPPAGIDLRQWKWSGALSLNYRNIGAKPIEIEIENQLLLTDLFFRAEGPVVEGTPLLVEFALDPEGRPELFRLAVRTVRLRRVELEFGRFLVPFGRINELYRPDLYPLVTKSLLYASPGLDFVSRVSYPHPLLSAGYSDTGARASFKAENEPGWVPKEITLFLVNGLQESPIRGRRPPESRTFLILDSVSGTDLDWGHEVNNLSDNNDTKNPGARVSWDYGDMKYPSPFSRAAFLNGVSASVSGMIGKYDIEDRLSNWVWSGDLGLRHREFRLTGEYMFGEVQSKAPAFGTAGSNPPTLIKDRYITYGHSVQLEFPFPEFWLSKQTRVVFRGESMSRRGRQLNLLGEFTPVEGHQKTRVNKFSGGVNSRLSPNFSLKMEYAHWNFDILPSIWQTAVAGVVSF